MAPFVSRLSRDRPCLLCIVERLLVVTEVLHCPREVVQHQCDSISVAALLSERPHLFEQPHPHLIRRLDDRGRLRARASPPRGSSHESSPETCSLTSLPCPSPPSSPTSRAPPSSCTTFAPRLTLKCSPSTDGSCAKHVLPSAVSKTIPRATHSSSPSQWRRGARDRSGDHRGGGSDATVARLLSPPDTGIRNRCGHGRAGNLLECLSAQRGLHAPARGRAAPRTVTRDGGRSPANRSCRSRRMPARRARVVPRDRLRPRRARG